MGVRESNTPEQRFDIEAGTPEPGEGCEPQVHIAVVTAAASPGLAAVATISLASPPRQNGVCRCGACLSLPESVDSWF